MIKLKKIIIIISVAVVILLFAGLAFAGNYFYNLALNPNTSKDKVFGTPNEGVVEVSGVEESAEIQWKKNKEWLLGESGYKDVYLNSEDGLKLHGYEVENKEPSDKWVISVHGYMGQGKDMSAYGKNFYDMGYNVLIPDLRSHGTSEGDYIGMGWDDRKDIIGWINKIIEKNSNAQIVLHGVSMGGGTVMMTSGENLPNNVKAIIEDCGYTSAKDEFAYQLKELFGLPKFPVINAASIVSKIRAGYWLGEASAIEQVAKSKTPMLFIHGDKDDFVPYSMLGEVYNAANCEKEKVVIEGAEHANSNKVNPELYWTSIYNFINKYVD
ncbi:alpha/beta hydrolase [Clostridium paraputrificum]|uniref:alpha/beta hydrolase n=1 Tax=Clostridium paraputrificum TaxID=29363 RepID=UPI003D32ADF1